MSQITTNDILRGGMFTITTPDGCRWGYEIQYVPARGRKYAAWYVRYVPNAAESYYVGYYDRSTGRVVLSGASEYSSEDQQFRIVFRVLRALFTKDYTRMQQFGDSIRKGTPSDPHEETPPPVSPSAPKNGIGCDTNNRAVKIGTLYHFDYDIHGKKYTMDYDTLYRRSIRTSESCYYFEASMIPWSMINDMNAAGCTANLVRTHDDEIAALLQRAEQQMAKRLQEQEESLETSLYNAETDYLADLQDETKSEETARKRRDNRIKSAIRSANVLSEQFAEQAKNYGLRISLAGLRNASDAMQQKLKAKAGSYVKAAEKLTGTLATVATNGHLPPEVLSDALRDEGNEEAANEFQSEFFDLETGM